MDNQLIENNTNKRFGDTQSIPKLLLFGYGSPGRELVAMIDIQQTDADPSYAAALFHATLATGLAEWIKRPAFQYNISQIAFGGGCFHNDHLLQSLTNLLALKPLELLTAIQMQPIDNVISLRQACIATRCKSPQHPLKRTL